MPVKYTDELLGSCTGMPPAGCRYCDRGSKMVLYVTGICTEDCFYCPLSEVKKGKDVIFANERNLAGDGWLDDTISEARRMSALGTGITGGDPMVVRGRTISAIKALKAAFGKRHHIHLYTSSPFSDDALEELSAAGLDEIRFHPPIGIWGDFGEDHPSGEAGRFSKLFRGAMDAGMAVGIEVPAVPEPLHVKGLRDLVGHAIMAGLDFVNLNELEASHTNSANFRERGFSLVGDSMAVEGSRELAEEVIRWAGRTYPGAGTVLHICSSVYKDAVQLRNRLRRTARNVRRPYEVMTEDGTLLRGIIVTKGPEDVLTRLGDEYGVPADLMEAQKDHVRVAPWVLEEISHYLEEECYISEVYPTYDGLEVERIPL